MMGVWGKGWVDKVKYVLAHGAVRNAAGGEVADFENDIALVVVVDGGGGCDGGQRQGAEAELHFQR